jgi:TMEM175 potassium channel family protein
MPKSRLEAFSDCVIAFAITLLILDIHLEDLRTNIDNAGMIHALLALAPRFSIYVISFLICTVAWVSHHELIHDMDCVDSRLLWLNNLYLMWIAFLPFPTGLLGHHPQQPVAVALYGAVCAITCLCLWVLRWYASFGGRLMKKEITEIEPRRDLWLSLYSCLLYLAGATVGFFFPWLGLFLYAAIPASYTISELVRRKGHNTVGSDVRRL